jgi:hypothetical protein
MSKYEKLDDKGLFGLIDVIDEIIVANKMESLGEYVCEVEKQHPRPSKSEIFDKIVNPDTQFQCTVEAIYRYFKIFSTSSQIEATLAIADESDPKKIERIICFYPFDKGPTKDVVLLQDKSSGFSRALRTQKIHIVEDARTEAVSSNPGYVILPGEEDEDYSLVCYPICHRNTGTYPLVLCVRVNTVKEFKRADKKKLLQIFEQFGRRLSIEYSLYRLRKLGG